LLLIAELPRLFLQWLQLWIMLALTSSAAAAAAAAGLLPPWLQIL